MPEITRVVFDLSQLRIACKTYLENEMAKAAGHKGGEQPYISIRFSRMSRGNNGKANASVVALHLSVDSPMLALLATEDDTRQFLVVDPFEILGHHKVSRVGARIPGQHQLEAMKRLYNESF